LDTQGWRQKEAHRSGRFLMMRTQWTAQRGPGGQLLETVRHAIQQFKIDIKEMFRPSVWAAFRYPHAGDCPVKGIERAKQGL
jgi:hypothetical protein